MAFVVTDSGLAVIEKNVWDYLQIKVSLLKEFYTAL